MRTEEEQNVSIKACNNAQITCNFSLLKLYFVGGLEKLSESLINFHNFTGGT